MRVRIYINELGISSFCRRFKTFREVPPGQIFTHLFISGIEHLIVYCRGSNLERFIKNALSLVGEEQLEGLKDPFKDVFDDLEDLMNKKQLKILASMIYDYNFTNFLVTFQEMLEIPITKTSDNELLHELFYFSKKLQISIVILTPKNQETKCLVPTEYVNIYLLNRNNEFSILYPYEYNQTSFIPSIQEDPLSGEIEDMRKINFSEMGHYEDDGQSESLSAVGYDRPNRLSRGASLDMGKNEKEEDLRKIRELEREKRMRLRAKTLKDKREKKRQLEQEKKIEEEKMAAMTKQELEIQSQRLMQEKEKEIRDRIRLEEENRLLREWKISEDIKLNELKTKKENPGRGKEKKGNSKDC